MIGLLEEILRWVAPAFRGTLGYVLVWATVLLERSILVGLVVPGDVILATGGIFASRGELSLVAVIVLGAVAAIMGESIGFFLGHRYGVAFIRRIPFLRRLEDKVDDVERLFAEHGGKAVFVGRFAAVAGAFIPFVAGMGRMRYRRFLAFDVPAIVLWATAISVVGFYLGKNVALVDRILRNFGWAMLGLLVVGIGLYVWWRRRSAADVTE
jgi:membrane protein DedA with SNARE-associated domain